MIKLYLCSDAIPTLSVADHIEVQNKKDFVRFTNSLLLGLRNCLSTTKGLDSDGPNYDEMKKRNAALKWKIKTVTGLLQEYEKILQETGIEGQTTFAPKIQKTPSFATSKTRFSSLNFLLWGKGRESKSPAPPPVLPPVFSKEKMRLCEIETQIGDLTGALHLRLNTNLAGLRRASASARHKVKISVAPFDTHKVGSIMNLPSYYKAFDTQQQSPPSTTKNYRPPFSNPTTHEWTFTCQLVRSKPPMYPLNDSDGLIQAYSDSWTFSSTECLLPVEAGANLVAEVLSAKKMRKLFDMKTFLTSQPQPITVELTLMTMPFVEIEVKWMPLTRMDLMALAKYPISSTLLAEVGASERHPNSMEENFPDSRYASRLQNRQMQYPHSPVEGECDRDGGFASMHSEANGATPSISSAGSIAILQGRKSLHADSPPCNSGSDNFIFQQYTANDRQDEGDFDRPDDKGGQTKNTCQDLVKLQLLFESVRNDIEMANCRPNRYGKILDNLSRVLENLDEQLSSTLHLKPISQKHKIIRKAAPNDLEKSLSMLDLAIGDTSAKFPSSVEVWTPRLTSGWDQLDSAIDWHLRNVSYLIQYLASSKSMYTPLSDSSNDTSLFIHEDLLAMALDAQSEILSDITGLALSISEAKEPLQVIIHSHCLGFCGSDIQTSRNSSGVSTLLPASFWSYFVWHTDSYSSASSASHASDYSGAFHPTLMINRDSLQEYLVKEYAPLNPKDQDEQSLECATEKLIEQLTDLDLMDITPWSELPLTQICHRLKPQNFQPMTRYDSQNLRPTSFNSRVSSSFFHSTSKAEPSISLALNYLIRQDRLQHELRESDEELLFNSLETMADNLEGSSDRRVELLSMSVENFVCLALILQHEDVSVTTSARRVISFLEDLTHSAYGMILHSNQLPNLRAAGPCCTFLKSMETFLQKTRMAASWTQGSGLLRRSNTNTGGGYSLLSPVGSAILWAMQLNSVEEYRVAALAAWECISAPRGGSVGPSSSPKHHFLNPRGAEDLSPIHAEIQRMNLADDSAEVRRLALRILMTRKKFRSTASSLNVPR